MIMITYDKEKGVTAGQYSTNKLHLVKQQGSFTGGIGTMTDKYPWESLVADVLGKCVYDIHKEYPFPKDRFKYYKEILGVSPTRFARMWNAVVLKNYIPQELRSVAEGCCRGYRGRYEDRQLKILRGNKDIILQCQKDGMLNVIPFLTTHEMTSIKEFRKGLGKSNWKKICGNSISRNKKISKVMLNNYSYRYNNEGTSVTDLFNTPSSLLRTGNNSKLFTPDEISILKKWKILSKPERVQSKALTIVGDTKRLAFRLDLKLPKGWTSFDYNKWKELHETYTELVNLQMYSNDSIPWLGKYDSIFESENYIATVLESKYLIQQEGVAMKHCVAGYGDYVEKGEYMVISIKSKEGDRRYSTLGVNAKHKLDSNKVEFTLNQHYKQCNAYVDNKEVERLAKDIIEQLNKTESK